MSIFDKAEQAAKMRKLPKWAQQIIDRQQGTINGLRKEMGMLTRKADPGDEIIFESWYHADTTLPTQLALPKGQLKLNLGTDKYGRPHEVGVVVETDYCGRKCVRLMGMQGPMQILPVASNTITVTTLRETQED